MLTGLVKSILRGWSEFVRCRIDAVPGEYVAHVLVLCTRKHRKHEVIFWIILFVKNAIWKTLLLYFHVAGVIFVYRYNKSLNTQFTPIVRLGLSRQHIAN